jgi:nitroreductase
METRQAILSRRSVRSFSPEPLDPALLTDLAAAARLSPSSANLQPLEYVVVTEPGPREELFQCLKWAAYTTPVGTPDQRHRPTAYIAVCVREKDVAASGSAFDVGAAVMAMLLLAQDQGVASCWIRSINRPRGAKLLGLPEGLELDSVIALGRPAQEAVAVDLAPEEQGKEAIRYWDDENGKHFVPKRALANMLHWQRHGGK